MAAWRFFSQKEPELTFEDLTRIEKKRRAILLRNELPFHSILAHAEGTVITVLLTDPLIWFTILLYTGFRVRMRFYEVSPTLMDAMEVIDVGLIGGSLTFFLVFYVQQCYARMNAQYFKAMGCEGRVLDTATMARARLPGETASRLIRYMNAAFVTQFVGLSSTYTVKNFFEPNNRQKCLLTKKELERVSEIDMTVGASVARELIAWSMMEIEQALNDKLIDGQHANQFRDNIIQLRANIGSFFDFKDQPVPFFYVHFLCLLTALYLPLYSIDAAYKLGLGNNANWSKDLFTGTIVLFQAIFVIGLRVLGEKLSDPFGSDLVDLSVMHYCTFTWKMSNRILRAHTPLRDHMPVVEAKIRFSRESIGAAWVQQPRSITVVK